MAMSSMLLRWYCGLLKGDLYKGRGSRQRSLAKSRYCKTIKVSQYGRVAAIAGFRDALISDRKLHSYLWTLLGRRLQCHCRPSEASHGDVLIEEFWKLYPDSYGRSAGHCAPPEPGGPELHGQIARGTRHDEGSSLDEGVPGKMSGHCGEGEPMKVGVGYVNRG